MHFSNVAQFRSWHYMNFQYISILMSQTIATSGSNGAKIKQFKLLLTHPELAAVMA
jgi:hypothetical protein